MKEYKKNKIIFHLRNLDNYFYNGSHIHKKVDNQNVYNESFLKRFIKHPTIVKVKNKKDYVDDGIKNWQLEKIDIQKALMIVKKNNELVYKILILHYNSNTSIIDIAKDIKLSREYVNRKKNEGLNLLEQLLNKGTLYGKRRQCI